jgi:O-antigen ligase
MWILFVPLAIALGDMPLIENMNLIMRPMLGLAILVGFFASRGHIQPGERTWGALLLFYMAALGLSCVNSVAPDAIAVSLGRQAFLMAVSLALVILFRDPETRLIGLKGLLLVVLSSIGLTFWVYLMLVPEYGLSYEGTRLIKGAALTDYGVGLNILSYLLPLALFGVRAAYRPGFLLDVLLFGAALLAILMMGSRATLLALALSWLIFAILRRMWRVSPLLFFVSTLIVASLAALSWMIVAGYAVEIREIFGSDVLRDISVGRTDMWEGGLLMWTKSPLFGWGPESWRVLLLEFLPTVSERSLQIISNLESGSFHNGFVTILAERGAVGFVSAVAMQIYMFYCAGSVYRHRELLPDHDRRFAGVLPVLVLFMFFRSLAESSGLFGNANSEVDYLTYFICSYLVALHAECMWRSREEMEASFASDGGGIDEASSANQLS